MPFSDTLYNLAEDETSMVTCETCGCLVHVGKETLHDEALHSA
jgi:hypothetical protein